MCGARRSTNRYLGVDGDRLVRSFSVLAYPLPSSTYQKPRSMSYSGLLAMADSYSYYGAHVTSWKTADGVERLYLHPASKTDGSVPVSMQY
jgi:hypothetical protein